LFIATGAGSVGRQIMGTTVIGGMLAATGMAIFLIPALYVLVERLASMRKQRTHASSDVPAFQQPVQQPRPMEAD
jgi:hydrophobic/amphiphilic exporter-1 (mainly G- bacteria), HAE1 family